MEGPLPTGLPCLAFKVLGRNAFSNNFVKFLLMTNVFATYDGEVLVLLLCVEGGLGLSYLAPATARVEKP